MITAIPVRVSVLGPVELTVAGQRALVGGPQGRAVLAFLVLGSGRVVPMERMMEGLWGSRPPQSAAIKIQGHVCALRKALRAAGAEHAADVIATRPPGYQLSTGRYSCDMSEFTSQVNRVPDLVARGDVESASAELGQALGRWRGPAFADVPHDDIRLHATHLERLRLIAVADKARLDLRLGRFWSVVEALAPEVHAHPLEERAREFLIHAYLRLGHRHAALECYEAGRVQLRCELGISPGPALQRLAQAIRRGPEAVQRLGEPASGQRPSRRTTTPFTSESDR